MYLSPRRLIHQNGNYYEKTAGDIKITGNPDHIWIKVNRFGEIMLSGDPNWNNPILDPVPPDTQNYWEEYDILEKDPDSNNYFKYGNYIIIQSDDGGSLTADDNIRNPTVRTIENDLSIVY